MTPTTPSRAAGGSAGEDDRPALDGGDGDGGGVSEDAGAGDDAGAGGDDDSDAAPGLFALPPGADPSLDWGLDRHRNPDGSPRIIERHLDVPPELAGLRLDHFVKTQIPRLSRTRIQAIIGDQLRRTDGPHRDHAPKPATIVVAGE